MDRSKLHRIPHRDPVSGGELHISELSSDETGITIRGRFEVPNYAKLDEEQSRFLETFLRCRGMINGVERELGISYPTARARLDALLHTLGMIPIEGKLPSDKSNDKHTDKRRKILELLEKGEISPEEAKQKLGVLN